MRNLIRTVIPVLLISLNYSCKSSQSSSRGFESAISEMPDSIFLSVKGLDLTEDMSQMSSKNDEVTLLFYELFDSEKQVKLVYSTSFTLTQNLREKRLSWQFDDRLKNSTYLVVLIERDTDQTTQEVEDLITKQYFEIEGYFSKQGNFGIEKYIGDNDIIGIKSIGRLVSNQPIDLEFKGFFKLDKYNYLLSVVAR